MKLERAYSMLDVKTITANDDFWTVKGLATSPKPDRLNDIVDPMGAQYAAEIPLLWQHEHKQPVGHTYLGAASKKGIPFEARIPKVKEPGKLKDRIEEAIQSLQYRLVAAVSIGFRVIDDAMEFLDNGGIRFNKTEIMELSLVTIPAHMDATIATVKSLDGARAASGIQRRFARVSSTIPPAGASAKNVTTNAQAPEGNSMKTIAEQIAAFEAKRLATAERMEALMAKAAEEDSTLDEAEEEEYDNLAAEVASVDKHLVRLRALERTQASKAAPVAGVQSVASGAAARSPSIVVTAGADTQPKGLEFARYVRCLVLAKGDPMRANEIAKAHFPDASRIHNVLKAAVNAGTTTDATWAAPLVDYTTLASEFIDFLRPQTIIGKFGVGGVPSLRRIPFNVRMGRQTSGGSGYWVGEGKPKPLTKFDYEEVLLRWAKVANIAVLTEELVRFSNPSADMLVRQALADALRERLDIDFIDPDKAEVTNVSPASITNGVVGITASGTDADAVRADIQAIMGQFIAYNLTPTTGVWIMSATNALALSLMQNALGQPAFPGITMNGGTFAGLPVITTEYMTTVADSSGSPIVLVNADDVFLADDGQVVIDASREASLQMDDAPTNASNPATATSVVSMFQTNSVALRAERIINWKKRRAGAVAMIVAAAYNAATP
jgi:HK97 family phage major capsid protein/HK97 family phage prohead protease